MEPLSVVDLLREGQNKLKAQELQNDQTEQEAINRSWQALRKVAVSTLHPLAVPVDPPEDFGTDNLRYSIELRPFAAASIFATYELQEIDVWVRSVDEFSIGMEYSPKDNDNGVFSPWPIEWEFTDDLAIAVALCYRADEAWRHCSGQCARYNATPNKENIQEDTLDSGGCLCAGMTEPETRLVLALRDMILEAVAGETD